MTVLLVEDDASVRENARRASRDPRIDRDRSRHTRRGRQALQRDSFLVVVLDVAIDDGSGLDLLEDFAVPDPPHVIMMSSASSESDRVRALGVAPTTTS